MGAIIFSSVQNRVAICLTLLVSAYCVLASAAQILTESNTDVHAREEALYGKVHGADALSTCLQWQGTITAGSSPVFQPDCGIKIRDRQGRLSEKFMPASGQGALAAQRIVDAAMARRPSSAEAFDDCDQWQALALDALSKENYPAYPNVTERYVSPRCGIRLSNNLTHEHVYLWLPTSLAPGSSAVENDKHRCVYQERADGIHAFKFLPCVLNLSDPGLSNTSFVMIETSPPGALLILDGTVIAQTPAMMVFQQPGSLTDKVKLHVSRKGYQEGDVSVPTSGVLKIKLSRSPQ